MTEKDKIHKPLTPELCENPLANCGREARFGIKFADGESLYCDVCTTAIIANAPDYMSFDGAVRELFRKCERCGEYRRDDSPASHYVCKDCAVKMLKSEFQEGGAAVVRSILGVPQ